MAGGGLFDLSAMMFPSTDPFAYPNQPMTALENRQFAKQEYPYDFNMYSQTKSTSSPLFDDLDAQFLGPMPQHLLHGQRSDNEMPSMNVPLDMMTGVVSNCTVNGGASHWAQQQGRQGEVTPGMNSDHIYGEDWSVGWMDQGYRQ